MRTPLILLIFLISTAIQAQSTKMDSLFTLLETVKNEEKKFIILKDLSDFYFNKNRKMSAKFTDQALEIAEKNHNALDVAFLKGRKGYFLNKEERFGEAFKHYKEALKLADNPKNEKNSWIRPTQADPYPFRMEILAGLHHDFGLVLRSTGNNTEAMQQFRICLDYLDKALPTSHNSAYMNMGAVYLDINQLDSALYYERKGMATHHMTYRSTMYKYIGDIYLRQGVLDSASYYYHSGLVLSEKLGALSQTITNLMGLTQLHLLLENKDSSLYYAKAFKKGFDELQGNPVKDINISNAYRLLYQAFKLRGQKDSTLKYLEMAFLSYDSLSSERIKNLTKYQNLSVEEQIRLEELEKEKLRTQNKIRVYSLISGLVFILILAFILFRNARQKQKANKILKQTLENLRSTQKQLIQSEKMASLGELTAGIAHEIQNPLNFVNNFSEVSEELVIELKEELGKGDIEEAKAISNDVIENLSKINHHGKRASFIVNGMLEHSRTSSGKKTPTDINILAEEFLKLSYHGLRAKDKNFNAKMKMDFDGNLPLVNAISQDLGRVILNLINNAFYAVDKKAKQETNRYKPEVIITTKKLDNSIEISVKDNGEGISNSIKEKIFQPFFTTKPTGEGTGLGLSLSYDIITKGHGGTLIVNTKEGEGTAFIIQLPL